MPGVLTTTSKIACSSQGTVTPSSQAKLKVDGNPVLLSSQATSWSVAGCGNTNSPCSTVTAPTAGVATKLTVQGTPVLLATFTAQAGGADPVTASGVQTKLTAS